MWTFAISCCMCDVLSLLLLIYNLAFSTLQTCMNIAIEEEARLTEEGLVKFSDPTLAN